MDTSELIKVLTDAALQSDCEKRRFGACATKGGKIIGANTNKRLPYHAFLCDGKCIRSGINSGTDSMVGACGHAEEGVLWALGKDAVDCEIYVVQLDSNGAVVPKTSKSFYCARCATAMYYAGASGVHVYVVDHFEFLTTEEAIGSAYRFALGEEKA